MQLDSTIHLSDIVLFGGGMLAFVRVWLAMRDDVRDHTTQIGLLKKTTDKHGDILESHGEVLNRMGWKRIADREGA